MPGFTQQLDLLLLYDPQVKVTVYCRRKWWVEVQGLYHYKVSDPDRYGAILRAVEEWGVRACKMRVCRKGRKAEVK
jgi:hypothetical protein